MRVTLKKDLLEDLEKTLSKKEVLEALVKIRNGKDDHLTGALDNMFA